MLKFLIGLMITTTATFAQAEKNHFGLYKLNHQENCFLAISPGQNDNLIYLSGVGNCSSEIMTSFLYKKSDDGSFEFHRFHMKFTDEGLQISVTGIENATETVPRFEPEQKD